MASLRTLGRQAVNFFKNLARKLKPKLFAPNTLSTATVSMFKYRAENSGPHRPGYYDQYPIVCRVGMQGNLIYGTNLHYVAPGDRAALIEAVESGDLVKVRDIGLRNRGFAIYRVDRVQAEYVLTLSDLQQLEHLPTVPYRGTGPNYVRV
jgi:hypothetical protein